MARISFSTILRRLQYNQSITTYQGIHDAKQCYLNLQRSYMPPPGTECCILYCTNKSKRTMNSLWYCSAHWGLALVHGFRHHCNACRLFSLMGLKTTGGDPGHQFDHLRRIAVPVVHDGTSDEHLIFNACIKTHCTKHFDPRVDLVYFVERDHDFKYWEEFTDTLEPVPWDSFVFWSEDWACVTAWMQVQLMERGSWRKVREQKEAVEILKLDRNSVHDGPDIILPCKPVFH